MKSKPPFENGFSYLLASDFDQTLSFNDSGYVFGTYSESTDSSKRCGWPNRTSPTGWP